MRTASAILVAAICWAVEFLFWLMYAAYQAVPGGRWKGWLADHIWYWQDGWAPRAFFEPMPTGNGTKLPGFGGFFKWQGFAGLSKIVVRKHVVIGGTVLRVEVDGPPDWPTGETPTHSTFVIAPADSRVMNRFNTAGQGGPGGLECELPVGSRLPRVGENILVRCLLAVDGANGWVEAQLDDRNAWSR